MRTSNAGSPSKTEPRNMKGILHKRINTKGEVDKLEPISPIF
jgi:hypothetical protein